jgi:hypothetical protein
MKAALAEAGIELVLWDLEQTPYPLSDQSFDVVVLAHGRHPGLDDAKRCVP